MPAEASAEAEALPIAAVAASVEGVEVAEDPTAAEDPAEVLVAAAEEATVSQ
jgi:hypothetical protein